jgi:hypothetical protein
LQLQGEVDVLLQRQPREQGRLLEHEGDLATADIDVAGARDVETGDEVEQRALTASTGADEAEELAFVHGHVDVVQSDRVLRAGAELLRDAAHGDGRTTGPHRHAGGGRPRQRSAQSSGGHGPDTSSWPASDEDLVEWVEVVQAVEIGLDRLDDLDVLGVRRALQQGRGQRVVGEGSASRTPT